MGVNSSDVVGAWVLGDFRITFSDDRPSVFPFGEDAVGQILYAASGHMSAVLSRADRPAVSASRLETAGSAPADEKAAAFDSYLSYGGTWSVDGDDIIHTVTHALTPNLVGQENRRHVTLGTDSVTLSYSLVARSGVTRTYTLRWMRP
ncbi:MAG: hypothetical protein ACJAZO_002079 [Myxococcota bacterium]|jgi:hypothetical protein